MPIQISPHSKLAMIGDSIIEEVAAKHDAVFVNTQAAFDAVLTEMHPMSLAWDRVHPNPTGHMVLACAFLNQIGFSRAA